MRHLVIVILCLLVGTAVTLSLAAALGAWATFSQTGALVAVQPHWPRPVPGHWPPPTARKRIGADGWLGTLRGARLERWSGIEEHIRRRAPGEPGTVRLARTVQVDLDVQTAGWPLQTLRWEQFRELDLTFDVEDGRTIERRTSRYWTRRGDKARVDGEVRGSFMATESPEYSRSIILSGFLANTFAAAGIMATAVIIITRSRRRSSSSTVQ